MTTPAEAIEAQRKVGKFFRTQGILNVAFPNLLTPEELARLYAIKDAFEKVICLLEKDDIGIDDLMNVLEPFVKFGENLIASKGNYPRDGHFYTISSGRAETSLDIEHFKKAIELWNKRAGRDG